MNKDLFITDSHLTKLKIRSTDFGGKVWGLVQLKKCGFDVPTFAVISSIACRDKVWRKEDTFRADVLDWLKSVKNGEDAKIIVRSSSSLEDQKYSSCAGVFKSMVLEDVNNVFLTLDDILEHAEKERDKRYKYSEGDISIVLQKYVKGQISGVCFSVDPVKANPEFGYGECVFGENKSLVDGSCIPTRFVFGFFPPRIVKLFPTDNAPSTIPQNILEGLVNCLLKMEQIFKYPVDIEWTWDGEKLWFLQVRYVTSLKVDPSLLPEECSTSWFFDQRFVEPITPFTRTTLLPRVFKMAHLDALQMRGKIPNVALTFFAGQAYIPHKVYIDILEGCPKWWLSDDLKQLFPGNCPCGYKKSEIIGIRFWVNSLYQLLKNYKHSIFVIRSWKRWLEKAKLTLESIINLELNSLTNEEWFTLWGKLQSLSDEFLMIHRWAILWANYIHRLGGKHIANFMRRCGLFPSSITRVSNMKLLDYLRTKDDGLKEEIMNKYYHRCENLDYSAPRWAENIDNLVNKVEEVSTGGSVYFSKDKKNKDLQRSGIIFRPLLFLFNLPIKYINLREEQRFEWEKVLYMQKRLVLEASRRMVNNGTIKEPNDVWFLTWEEFINCFITKNTIPENVVAQRKHEWYIYHGFKKPLFVGKEQKMEQVSSEYSTLELKGVGASYGRVKGTVHLMNSPDDLLPSIPRPRILVGHCLNPGQTWCLEMWDGFILETGSELSHPAILARECEIPMITAVKNAFDLLNEGDIVEIDCNSGIVRIEKNPD